MSHEIFYRVRQELKSEKLSSSCITAVDSCVAGFSHGFNLRCRSSYIAWFLSDCLRAAGRPVFCPSLLTFPPWHSNSCIIPERVRFLSLAPKLSRRRPALLHSLTVKRVWTSKTFFSFCLRFLSSLSGESKETAQLREASEMWVYPSRKGHAVRRFWMNADRRSVNFYNVTIKLICHISLSSECSSRAKIVTLKSQGRLLSPFVLRSKTLAFFLWNNKGFHNDTVCGKHFIICRHCYSGRYIMDAFVCRSLQS